MGKRITEIIKYVLECVLEVIYPHSNKCLCCESDTDTESICDRCLNNVAYIYGGYYLDKEDKVKCHSAAYYSGSIKELIINLKYSANFESAEFLAHILYKKMKEEHISGDLITYVPISKASSKKRGFNQCRAIGKELSNLSRIKLVNTLRRSKEVKEQKRLSIDERVENMIGVFEAKTPRDIENKIIILIDDVITTGSTLMSCRDALIKAGAGEVILLTVAKSNI
ncbi:ComF family protein [Clostridium folliculivorans]|uniref:Amidophosphoribosyltransferase n=1 Tax=Clostridium folliculivorans TaxID=2886038 RepID=A0A9W5XYG1_9CLOT|nr:phosphoribosyltransferase family protein [Clostridium folliculivorans]GKU23331.1 amidophosphoribosyltransferase [Clostridium folliculivorans]GKU29448.1 amidophosphoribosyltransferase [Clostridium folliculivorans]